MRILFIFITSSALLTACADKRNTTPTSTSINTENAQAFAKLGMQQFIALHNGELLTRNTVVNAPNYASPCSSGTYAANFIDVGSVGSLDTGDSITETYDMCTLNTGNVRVTGHINSKVTALSNRIYTLDIQHKNINLVNLSTGQIYQYSGDIQGSVDADLNFSSITSSYRNYTINFNAQTATINSGESIVKLQTNNNSYSIEHHLIFSTPAAIGLLRTDTTTQVTGQLVNNHPLFSGDPALITSEDEAIQAKKDALAIEKSKASGLQDAALIIQLEADIKTLEQTRKSFRPFVGRLRIESTIDSQFVEMVSEDSDDDITTYQQNVRANRTTTSTLGHKWVDLL